jgi:hypothetical protein
MRPLRPVEAAVDREEQADGRAEQLVILEELRPAGGLVVAFDADGGVKRLAAGAAANGM